MRPPALPLLLVTTLAAFAVSTASAAAQTTPLGGTDPRAITLYDADGDGDLDAAVADFATDSVEVLTNDRGVFSSARIVGFGGFGGPEGVVSIAHGDYDGDGITDFALSSSLAAKGIIIMNHPGGGASLMTHALTSTNGTAVASANLNNLGPDDLVFFSRGDVLNPGSIDLVIDGVQSPLAVPPGISTSYVDGTIADVDGDGVLDIVALADEIQIYLAIGPGGVYRAPILISPPQQCTAVDAFDVDRDGRDDLCCTAPQIFPTRMNELFVCTNCSDPTPTTARIAIAGTWGIDLAFGDFDGNMQFDALVVDATSTDVMRHCDYDPVTPGFLSNGPVLTGVAPIAVTRADVNGDGFDDSVVLDNGGNSFTLAVGGPAGSAAAYGIGCAGTAGLVPAIGITGMPVLGTSFSIDLANARASSFSLLLFGLREAAVPLPVGCTLLVDTPVVVASRMTDALGTASYPIIVPTDPTLARLELNFQWVVRDDAGAFLGMFAMSDGQKTILGTR